ncbi:MAG: helix-turn-helix domain-containing protein [Oscillospiraceae bacterium]|nr:helix-turn-helix domain-containing protein [Oscillospiraceae bacterium]
MQIYFGESLRRLRREKNMTQEQLAQRLNVSFQTISNWERNENWPDLSMLPVLAGLFNVKVDELLGVNEAENERRIQEILTRYENNRIPGEQIKEYTTQLNAMLKEFPSEWRLWRLHFGLMTALGPDDTAERVRERLPEVRMIYDNILENCTIDAIRIDVKGNMCHFLIRIVQRDPENCAAESAEIKRIINELPDLLSSREYKSTMFLPGTQEECKTACQEAIISTVQMLNYMLTHLNGSIEPTVPEYLHTLRTKLALFDLFFPHGDFGKHSTSLMYDWSFIALWHAHADEFDEAFAALHRAVELILAYDKQPPSIVHTSPLLAGLANERVPGYAEFSYTNYLHEMYTDSCYEELFPWPQAFREDPRFAEMLAQLSK